MSTNTSSGPDPTSDPATDPTTSPTDPGPTETTPSPTTSPSTTSPSSTPSSEPTTPTPSPTPTPTPTPSPSPSSDPDPTSSESTTQPPPNSSTDEPPTTILTVTPPSSSDSTSTFFTTVTSGTNDPGLPSTSPPPTGTPITSPEPQDQSSGGGGMSQEARIAVAVVVPIVGVTLLILAFMLFWRRRQARKAAEEQRKQELDDYAYTPHADPTIPSIGLASDGQYAVKEDGSGYRGWGTTVAGSPHKGSTTLSGGMSDTTSPTQVSEAPMTSAFSSEGEILAAMAPAAATTKRGGGDVHRGPSNASSSYSAARSDVSDGIGVAYGSGAPYYEAYNVGNPYEGQQSGSNSPPRPSDLGPQQQQQQPAPPVIRDNPARRNPRIENPAHYPQQTAGISQNF